MNRDKMIQLAYSLRREGVRIVTSKDGRFPLMVVLNPSERLRKKSVEVKTKSRGQEQVWNIANENGISVYW